MKRKGSLQSTGDILQGSRALAIRPTHAPEHQKTPAQSEFENRQLSLFQSFLFNREGERDRLSNVIDLWDSVPRYSISRQAMTKSRINGRFLERHETQFQRNSQTYTRTISPARVLDLDGVERDYFPSANEELVEDAPQDGDRTICGLVRQADTAAAFPSRSMRCARN